MNHLQHVNLALWVNYPNLHSPGIGERAKGILELIHSDVCGPMPVQARSGSFYFITFTDDFSRFGMGIPYEGISPKPLRNSGSLRMKWRNNLERVSRLFDQIEEVNT